MSESLNHPRSTRIGKYNATIAWAVLACKPTTLDGEERTEEERDRWVTAYLAGWKHWEALEGHLRAIGGLRA